ncbi:MAG: hypothetical protein HQL82_03275 [Magnetococcales bacterium]|nr:hypothetical protein [Magnetococcales bacterium]
MSITGAVSSIPLYDAGATKIKENSADAEQLQIDFLKMLTAQLEFQDPLEPLENTEFTQQMAQFSSLGEQQRSNELLQKLITSQGTDQVNQAVSFIGKQVYVEGDGAVISGGSGVARFELSSDATATIRIKNADGRTVREIPAQAYGNGENTVDFNNAKYGAPLPDGAYTFDVVVENGDASLKITTLESGKVTGVSRTDEGVMLDLNGRLVPVDQVRRVEQALS